MASLLGVIVMLSILVRLGYPLSCQQCVSSTSSSCTGSNFTCPSGYQCGALYTVTTIGNSIDQSYTKSCLPQDQCTLNGSLTTNGARIQTVAACCNTDNCTPTLPTLPGASSVSNGVTCRSCVSADSTWCYTPETIKCTGNENMCLLQTTKISGSTSLSTAFRGCSTKSFCDFGSQSYTASGITTEVKFICTSGGIGLQKVLYLPAVICLFFLKLLI